MREQAVNDRNQPVSRGNGANADCRWLLVIGLAAVLLAATQIARPPVTAFMERQAQTLLLVRQACSKGAVALLTRPTLPFGFWHGSDSNVDIVCRYEVPVHALGALVLRPFGLSEVVAAHLVSLLFGVITLVAFVGALRTLGVSARSQRLGLWILAWSPLFLMLSASPMPDIVSIGFYSLALLWTLRRRVLGSAIWCSAALLAKASIAPFLLPLFIWLFWGGWPVAKATVKDAVIWLIVALVPVAGWSALAFSDGTASWNLWEAFSSGEKQTFPGALLTGGFYLGVGAYIVVLGIGFAGLAGVAKGVAGIARRFPAFGAGIAASLLFVLLFMSHYMMGEPQYTLPVLFLACLVAALGFDAIPGRKIILGLIVLWIPVQAIAVWDLWMDRCPDAAVLLAAGRAMPADARILQVSPSSGAVPSYWLNRPVSAIERMEDAPELALRKCVRAGFTHLVFIDYTIRGNALIPGARDPVPAADLDRELWDWSSAHLPRGFAGPGVTVFDLKPLQPPPLRDREGTINKARAD